MPSRGRAAMSSTLSSMDRAEREKLQQFVANATDLSSLKRIMLEWLGVSSVDESEWEDEGMSGAILSPHSLRERRSVKKPKAGQATAARPKGQRGTRPPDRATMKTALSP